MRPSPQMLRMRKTRDRLIRQPDELDHNKRLACFTRELQYGRSLIQAFVRKSNGVITEEQYNEPWRTLLGSFGFPLCSTHRSGARFQTRWRRGSRASRAWLLTLAR